MGLQGPPGKQVCFPFFLLLLSLLFLFSFSSVSLLFPVSYLGSPLNLIGIGIELNFLYFNLLEISVDQFDKILIELKLLLCHLY